MNFFYISVFTSKNKMGIEDVLLDVSLTLLCQKKKELRFHYEQCKTFIIWV